LISTEPAKREKTVKGEETGGKDLKKLRKTRINQNL